MTSIGEKEIPLPWLCKCGESRIERIPTLKNEIMIVGISFFSEEAFCSVCQMEIPTDRGSMFNTEMKNSIIKEVFIDIFDKLNISKNEWRIWSGISISSSITGYAGKELFSFTASFNESVLRVRLPIKVRSMRPFWHEDRVPSYLEADLYNPDSMKYLNQELRKLVKDYGRLNDCTIDG